MRNWIIIAEGLSPVTQPLNEGKFTNAMLGLGAMASSATAQAEAVPPTTPTSIEAPAASGVTGNIDLLKKVQSSVNSRIRFSPEQDGKDNWRIPNKGSGDCEDFALLKRITLIDAGWDADDLKIVLVSRKSRNADVKGLEGHAVLVSKSTKMVLDSPLDTSERLSSVNVQDFGEWAKAGGWRRECDFQNISYGQIDGPVTNRCPPLKKK